MASKEAPHGLAPVKAKALDISPLFRKGEVPSVSTESEDKSKWISQISEKYKNDLEIAAPDLKSEGLSGHYANTLLKKLGKDASSINELVETGKKEFYQLGKHVYGPLAVSFVDDVLKNAGEDDIIMFPPETRRHSMSGYPQALSPRTMAPITCLIASPLHAAALPRSRPGVREHRAQGPMSRGPGPRGSVTELPQNVLFCAVRQRRLR